MKRKIIKLNIKHLEIVAILFLIYIGYYMSFVIDAYGCYMRGDSSAFIGLVATGICWLFAVVLILHSFIEIELIN